MDTFGEAIKMFGLFIGIVIFIFVVGFICYFVQMTFGLAWTIIPVVIYIFGLCYFFAWLNK